MRTANGVNSNMGPWYVTSTTVLKNVYVVPSSEPCFLKNDTSTRHMPAEAGAPDAACVDVLGFMSVGRQE